MNTNLTEIERRLWSAADELRANSRLRASEYSTPVLGLIFLRYAEHKFTQAEQEICNQVTTGRPRGMFVQSAEFIVDRVDRERLKDDPRFPFGMPRVDNANYLWIQLFYSALSEGGRAGFVMANSAADARASELEIRRQIIESRAVAHAVHSIVGIASNFFHTVTWFPCTLWLIQSLASETSNEIYSALLEISCILNSPQGMTKS